MPTALPRVQVTVDPELAEALARSEAAVPNVRGRAGLIRELALRGVRALEDDERGRKATIERFIDRSTRGDPGFDVEVARDIERLAWGQDG